VKHQNRWEKKKLMPSEFANQINVTACAAGLALHLEESQGEEAIRTQPGKYEHKT
jgi:hypothetical protein